jgi:hypothetical protein
VHAQIAVYKKCSFIFAELGNQMSWSVNGAVEKFGKTRKKSGPWKTTFLNRTEEKDIYFV